MSHFYGSMMGRSFRKTVTRCGDNSISAHVRGWNIGGCVSMRIDSLGRDVVCFELTGGSNENSTTLENAPNSYVEYALNPDGTVEQIR
jgi:hypothetical protein